MLSWRKWLNWKILTGEKEGLGIQGIEPLTLVKKKLFFWFLNNFSLKKPALLFCKFCL
jgi:hypothetical protein